MQKFLKVKCVIENNENINDVADAAVNTYEEFEAKATKELQLLKINSEIDLNEVNAFTEFISEDNKIEHNLTMVYTKSGSIFCVDFPFEKFSKLYHI